MFNLFVIALLQVATITGNTSTFNTSKIGSSGWDVDAVAQIGSSGWDVDAVA